MRHLSTIVVATAVSVLIGSADGRLSAQSPPAAGAQIGRVTLPRPVLANGQTIPAGTYQIRLSGDVPTPAVGQSPEGAQYVEFLRAGAVVGREVATVISAADVGQVAKGRQVPLGTSRVDLLRGADYLRVWINSGGTHFIIHMPPA